MGYSISKEMKDQLFAKLAEVYDLYAPVLKKGEGCFSDTDVVRYGKITSFDEIEWERKSDYSFKEAIFPINETLFYFTEDQVTVPAKPEKERMIFLRSCDLHGLQRLDDIYMQNGNEDYYYKRRRAEVKFVLMGCSTTCESGFCVSMGTNKCDTYDLSFAIKNENILIDCRDSKIAGLIEAVGLEGTKAVQQMEVCPDFVKENKEAVRMPKHISSEIFSDEIWKEYGSRCIGCGRCNFVCPTCTCFTMQDIFYQDNKNVGERRRVWASCQVDGFTDMAGNIIPRKDQSDRFRFKVLHKISDHEKKFGHSMCVGCGRCDDICPEYISYSNLINRLADKEA